MQLVKCNHQNDTILDTVSNCDSRVEVKVLDNQVHLIPRERETLARYVVYANT